MPVVQSYTINFEVSDATAEEGGYLKFESDTDKTKFYPGEISPYRLYSVGTILFHRATNGTITAKGSDSRAVQDDYRNVSGEEVTLDYPVSSGLVMAWQGSVFDADGNPVSSPPLPTLQDDKVTLSLPGKRYGILKVSYTASYAKYELSGVPTNVRVAKIFAGASA